eukprot:c7935_g1_i2.p1 GENE.c7935_g1_i2~~c7935_g1_i2.p1  ORF type:complete len:263 (-),score=57.58 c7935_g1_i2:261-1049(-)
MRAHHVPQRQPTDVRIYCCIPNNTIDNGTNVSGLESNHIRVVSPLLIFEDSEHQLAVEGSSDSTTRHSTKNLTIIKYNSYTSIESEVPSVINISAYKANEFDDIFVTHRPSTDFTKHVFSKIRCQMSVVLDGGAVGVFAYGQEKTGKATMLIGYQPTCPTTQTQAQVEDNTTTSNNSCRSSNNKKPPHHDHQHFDDKNEAVIGLCCHAAVDLLCRARSKAGWEYFMTMSMVCIHLRQVKHARAHTHIYLHGHAHVHSETHTS